MNVLGISAHYHDSAACLLRDGKVVAACQEERFSRVKHDESFPSKAIESCLATGGGRIGDMDLIAYYEKPLAKFDRIVESFLFTAPAGVGPFCRAMPSWLRSRLWIEEEIRKATGFAGKIIFTGHHEAHAASAFFPSPFREAAVVTVDGVGEWSTASISAGRGDSLEVLRELRFPHSLGLLYSAFTAYLGFRVNSGEYKMMGLSAYGKPHFVSLILKELVETRDDGSFLLNMEYFDVLSGKGMTNDRFHRLFGGPPRGPDGPITDRHKDLACSVQQVTEDILLRMVDFAHRETGLRQLCLGGGVALNCVANGRILREGPFDDLWVQPASGDAGGALGAALVGHHLYSNVQREYGPPGDDGMDRALLGPSYSDDQIAGLLKDLGVPFERLAGAPERFREVAGLLSEGKVVGWFQGRMEYGPRALGNRSILADPTRPEMADRINRDIKFREPFRPFAPAVLEERVGEFFRFEGKSPYMLLAADVRNPGLLPAVTHVDGSARIQTVSRSANPELYGLIEDFSQITGCPVLLNTSFNVRGEPIVCAPRDAVDCFFRSGLDALVMGSYLVRKGPVGGQGWEVSLETPPSARVEDVPSRRTLALFGLSLSAPFLVLAVTGFVKGWTWIVPAALLSVAAGIWIHAMAAPNRLLRPFRIASRLAVRAARMQTRFVLGAAYFLVLTPVGVLMRLSGWDPFRLRRRKGRESNWEKAPPSKGRESYDRLF